MKAFALAAIAAAALFGLAAPAAQAAPVLSIVPSTSTAIAVGGTFSADIVVTGALSAGEIVAGYSLDVTYDPAVLAWQSATQFYAPFGGNSVTTIFGVVFDQSTPGHLLFGLTSLLTDTALAGLQTTDSVTLGSLELRGLTDGYSYVNFGLDPDFQRNVTGRDSQSLNFSQVNGVCVAVGDGSCPLDVPEPASLPLALLALGACGAAGVRRRSAAASPVAAA